MKALSTAMRNLAYFAYNFPNDFIEKAWASHPQDIEHIKGKFSSAYSRVGPKAAVIAFALELSENNQEILFDWIVKNYSFTGVEQQTEIVDKVTAVWKERVEFQDYNRSSNNYMERQAEFFIGAMVALGINPPLWALSIMSGRDIITEWENVFKNDNG